MSPTIMAVFFERVSELVEGKMATYKALRQVAAEIRALDNYCNENHYTIPHNKLTTKHLATGKYKP